MPSSVSYDRKRRFAMALLGAIELKAMGSAGSLVQGDGDTPSHTGSLVYIHVDQIDPTLEKIAASGGKTLKPRISIGEHGFSAHFEDSEGNRVALHETP